MIKSTDLRQGNFVKTFTKGKKKLVKLSAQDIADIDQKKLEVFPIPLVREWLERFQFTTQENVFIHFKSSGYHLQQMKDGFYFIKRDNRLNEFPMLYVHQLQNAFYWMVGEDLTF